MEWVYRRDRDKSCMQMYAFETGDGRTMYTLHLPEYRQAVVMGAKTGLAPYEFPLKSSCPRILTSVIDRSLWGRRKHLRSRAKPSTASRVQRLS